jgi:hypothetical protein
MLSKKMWSKIKRKLYLRTHYKELVIGYFSKDVLQGLLAVPWLRRLVAGLSPWLPEFAPRSIQWDLWWTKWHWDRFFSESSGFPLSILFHRGLHISEN